MCKSRLIGPLGLALLSLSQHALGIAQQPTPEAEDAYITEAFKSADLPLPQLGWILPSGDLVTEMSALSLLVLSDNPAIVGAKQSGSIPSAKIKQFVRQEKIDCDQLNEPSPTALFLYKTGLPPQKEARQVLVINASSGSIHALGSNSYKSSPVEEAVLWKPLATTPANKNLARSFAIPGSQFFYVVAGTYDRKGVLIRSGIFLEDHSGQILGKEIDDVQGSQQCDGCGVITIKDGINAIYPVLNVVQIPGLTYPALLADTSTVEGRAIELFTFSPKGEPSRIRFYEYMVTCILGTADEQAKP